MIQCAFDHMSLLENIAAATLLFYYLRKMSFYSLLEERYGDSLLLVASKITPGHFPVKGKFQRCVF